MAQAYQLCAGVGYGRKSGFSYESYIVAVIEKRQQRLHFFRFGMLVKFMKLKLLYMSFQSGRVEIRQLITISKLKIAGCYVVEGKVTNSSKVRVVRDGIVVHEGVIESLRRFKDDVKEVAQGFECGITLEKFSDLKEGDIFEVYDMEEIAVE